jgi:hypothetical protein
MMIQQTVQVPVRAIENETAPPPTTEYSLLSNIFLFAMEILAFSAN